jgi:hypothetical protein
LSGALKPHNILQPYSNDFEFNLSFRSETMFTFRENTFYPFSQIVEFYKVYARFVTFNVKFYMKV